MTTPRPLPPAAAAPDPAAAPRRRRRSPWTDLGLLAALAGFVALKTWLGGGFGEWVVIAGLAVVLFARRRA